MRYKLPAFVIVVLLICGGSPAFAATHGIDLYNELKYPADFTHFEYVNPDAPKGGDLVLAGVGSFDSLNPFVIKGTAAAGMSYVHPSFLYATLLSHTADEANSSYCYIAEKINLSPDRRSVVFTLRKEAAFHDGSPITSEDVVFTFDTLKAKGQPFYKAYYREIVKAEAIGDRQVKFTFMDNKNRELPIIIGEMPILSKRYYQTNDFSSASLKIPLGSGPYKIKAMDPGKSITYERVKGWWGENLPVNKGRYNFDQIGYLYFLDPTVAFEAFKSGDVDFRMETSSKRWVAAYDFPAIRSGAVKKITPKKGSNQGMFGIGFNTRRPIFNDVRVRRAIARALDFEWVNENIFSGLYKRSRSYFENSEFAARGLPTGEELAILNRFKDKLPPQIFTQEFRPPINKKPGDIRIHLKEAREMLEEAGWVIENQKRVNAKTKVPLRFEILITSPEYLRPMSSFIRHLKRLGIEARTRMVDSAQYAVRIDEFDFDIIMMAMGQSESPGNEQLEFWSSKAADIKGSRNYSGIKDPVVDSLIELLIDAPTRKKLVQRTQALDRTLLWGHYVIPGWYSDRYWLAFWNKFDRPKITPKYLFDITTWWVDPAKEAALLPKSEKVAKPSAAAQSNCPRIRRYRYRP